MLVAFLDDLYLMKTRDRASGSQDAAVSTAERLAASPGTWEEREFTASYSNTEGQPPDVWRGDRPLAEHGLLVLGSAPPRVPTTR